MVALAGMTLAANAQQALGPGTGLVSPEINPDHSVTFRYVNPKAKTVQVTGDFLPTRPVEVDLGDRKMVYDAPGVADLKEGRDGVWTYTSAPLKGELYSYSFLVDGKKAMDPSNIYQNRDVATWTNIFTLSAEPGDLGWYYQVNDVRHGTLAHVWYDSPTLSSYRRLTIYLPPGYEDSIDRYPVLYLLHGSGGDEDAWTDLGRTAQIMDNLIAEGYAKPMIVVMPNGVWFNQAAPGAAVNMFQPTMANSRSQSTKEIEDSFTDVMNFVEKHYHVAKGSGNTAVAGLSMGGRQSGMLPVLRRPLRGRQRGRPGRAFRRQAQTLLDCVRQGRRRHGQFQETQGLLRHHGILRRTLRIGRRSHLAQLEALSHHLRPAHLPGIGRTGDPYHLR